MWYCFSLLFVVPGLFFGGVDWVGFWRYIDPSDQNDPFYQKYEIKATDIFGEQSPKFNIWMSLKDNVTILWSYLIWAFEYFLVKLWSAFNRLPLARWHRLALICDEHWGSGGGILFVNKITASAKAGRLAKKVVELWFWRFASWCLQQVRLLLRARIYQKWACMWVRFN